MPRIAIVFGLVFACASISVGARVWSASQDMPAGTGKDTTVRLCKNCHPLERVVAVRRSNKEWIAMVEKMLAQGAEGKADEFNEAIDYLTDHYGKPVAMNTATADEIIDGLGLDEADAKAIVAYRTGHPPFATWKDVAAVPDVDATWIERRQKNLTFGSVTSLLR